MFSQVLTLNDNFEGNGNITTWTEGQSAINTAFSNPYNEEINTSNRVLKYEDTGGEYAHVSFQTSENFILSQNSSFSLKIYVPSNSIKGVQPNQNNEAKYFLFFLFLIIIFLGVKSLLFSR
jgi:hypothetical protein